MPGVVRIRESEGLQPYQVVLLAIVALTLAGCCLLLSAPRSEQLVDGAREWSPGSTLEAVVAVLCLNYRAPTLYAGEVKVLVLNLGTALALAVLAIALATGKPVGETAVEAGDGEPTDPLTLDRKRHIAPLYAAQVLVVLYLLWSLASSRWSAAPELARGGTILLALQYAWALALGLGLNPRGARVAARAVVIITAVTSAVALWYYYERNPVLRAKFPFGNPLFLAAALLPGLLVAGAWFVETVRGRVEGNETVLLIGDGHTWWVRFRTALRLHPAREGTALVVSAATLVLGIWAFILADSRGAQAGLVFALLAAAFFALRGWWRAVPVGLAVVAGVAGAALLSAQTDVASPTGRDATARLRLYAWSYAWRMFEQAPLKGHGQGGFVLAGDGFVIDDVLEDPLPFVARLAHAHNEWLEVLADLGAVGLVLVAGVILLTLRAGMAALQDRRPPPGLPDGREGRWLLVALLAALVGMVVEEMFDVGLRVSDVPPMFYTVLGLIWAFSRPERGGLVAWLVRHPGGRAGGGVVAVTAALAALWLAQQDFAAARATYSVEDALQNDKYEQAIKLAETARHQLNPQRALSNLFRLGEAHARSARQLQARASDRRQRAQQTDPPDEKLLLLAAQDYSASEEHCKEGSKVLKEVVSRAPTYLNQGYLEYLLLVTQADNPTARNAPGERELLLAGARLALDRELQRQPYNPELSLAYVQLAFAEVEPALVLDIMARPLRHHSITLPVVQTLLALASEPTFEDEFEGLVAQAQAALGNMFIAAPPEGTSAPPAPELESPAVPADRAVSPPRPDTAGPDRWAPEKLRLAATLRFWQGDYAGAAEVLEQTAPVYDRLAATAPYGAAAAWFELADCRFHADPTDPQRALTAAHRALELTPSSQDGRRLRRAVQQRVVTYELAADNEAEARRQLHELLGASRPAEQVQRELGVSYARMCYQLLQRRKEGLRVPPSTLPERFPQWVARGLELAPQDPLGHFLAADLAVGRADCTAAADHLEQALRYGLPPQDAAAFLDVAGAKLPDCAPLAALAEKLTAGAPGEAPKPSAVPGWDAGDAPTAPDTSLPEGEPAPAPPPEADAAARPGDKGSDSPSAGVPLP
ncbi:MAG TPA: O-antigen ligase family protein [Phycisphaerae bacterium]|nr:O-antigen ligase family protein [Phycisphaerae bacterium]HNU45376.1 O-antigen ligase family protein [Phycisphaerae bacterium]